MGSAVVEVVFRGRGVRGSFLAPYQYFAFLLYYRISVEKRHPTVFLAVFCPMMLLVLFSLPIPPDSVPAHHLRKIRSIK